MSTGQTRAAFTYFNSFLRVAIVALGLLAWTGIGALLSVAIIVLGA